MATDAADGNSVGYFVDRHEREGRGASLMCRDPWRSLSYGALAEATRRFAGALRGAGIPRQRAGDFGAAGGAIAAGAAQRAGTAADHRVVAGWRCGADR